jgi:hypothetical protein
MDRWTGTWANVLAERQTSLTFWHRSFTFNSNKSPTWCSNFSVYYPDVCLQLNMFGGVFPPIIMSSMTAVAVSGFTFVSWWQSRSVHNWADQPNHKHSTTVTTIRRYNQRLPLQSLSSWRWVGKRPKQTQDNKLKNCCITLVIYLNCTMLHGLTNLKFYI